MHKYYIKKANPDWVDLLYGWRTSNFVFNDVQKQIIIKYLKQ